MMGLHCANNRFIHIVFLQKFSSYFNVSALYFVAHRFTDIMQ